MNDYVICLVKGVIQVASRMSSLSLLRREAFLCSNTDYYKSSVCTSLNRKYGFISHYAGDASMAESAFWSFKMYDLCACYQLART